MLSDYVLARLLQAVEEKSKFVISFQGMGAGLDVSDLFAKYTLDESKATLLNIKLKAFDLSSEPCLPQALFTEMRTNIVISVILVICLVTTIFDAYLSRTCAQICDIFFPVRANERAEYLHKRLKAGRGKRRFQLNLIIGQYKGKTIRLIQISPWMKVANVLFRCCQKYSPCPGCGYKVKKDELLVNAHAHGICEDCAKDV